MSDTDSAVLTKPLPDHLVGKDLGKMKLENRVQEGILIRKKLYYFKTQDNQEVIRSSGIDASHLDYNLFLNLLNGESVSIKKKLLMLNGKL